MMTRLNFKQLNLKEHGIQKVLGELEAKVMEIIWAKGEATSRQIHQALARYQKLAPTTVTTILSRLVEKGLIIKSEDRRGGGYRPSVTKTKFLTAITKKLIMSWLSDKHLLSAVRFEETLADLSAADKKALRDFLKKK